MTQAFVWLTGVAEEAGGGGSGPHCDGASLTRPPHPHNPRSSTSDWATCKAQAQGPLSFAKGRPGRPERRDTHCGVCRHPPQHRRARPPAPPGRQATTGPSFRKQPSLRVPCSVPVETTQPRARPPLTSLRVCRRRMSRCAGRIVQVVLEI